MRSTILLSASLALAAFAGTAAETTPGKHWKEFAEIPTTVIGPAGVVLNDRIHVLGGADSAAHQVYNPASDSWSVKAAMPAPEGIGWGMAAPFKGKIYLFGGGYGKQWRGDKRAWVYDPASDKWTAIAPMPVRRMQGSAVTAGNAIYIIGGHQGTARRSREEEIKTVYKYDPAKNTYTTVAPMPEAGIFTVAAYYKGNIVIAAGVERTVKNPTDAGEGYVWGEGILKYNVAKDKWTKLDLKRPATTTWMVTQHSSHVAIGPKLFMAGGGTPPDRRRTDKVFYFDMDQDKFVDAGRLPRVRCCAVGGVVKGKLYILGGFFNETGDRCPEVWGYPFGEAQGCCGN